MFRRFDNGVGDELVGGDLNCQSDVFMSLKGGQAFSQVDNLVIFNKLIMW